jgi:hypothetical protein
LPEPMAAFGDTRFDGSETKGNWGDPLDFAGRPIA